MVGGKEDARVCPGAQICHIGDPRNRVELVPYALVILVYFYFLKTMEEKIT